MHFDTFFFLFLFSHTQTHTKEKKRKTICEEEKHSFFSLQDILAAKKVFFFLLETHRFRYEKETERICRCRIWRPCNLFFLSSFE